MLLFQLCFELVGTISFAISGAALGLRKHMDLLGVTMLGMITAVGGGMLRDVLLGQIPPRALVSPLHALVAILVSLIVFLPHVRRFFAGEHPRANMALLLADSIGLGVFTVHGVRICMEAGHGSQPFLVLFLAVLTGVGGGVLRDMLCVEKPYIFTKHIYACASLLGALLCWLLWPVSTAGSMVLGAALILTLRICAARWRWSLPKA
ncbi:MAG: trimeric intracellular cation channel family protein [Ruminococcaceae bacterium]|nr:trimeric intracellular cation channel family protein [Oscillospiraceae bacterium]